MADATRSPGTDPSAPSPAATTRDGNTPELPSLPLPPSEPTEGYQPVSLLAGLALVVACLYTVIIVIGAFSAFLAKAPLLLEWSFLLPAVSLLLAWMARTRILNSEGALTGLALTRWSIWLSVVVALSYGAYYLATRLAIGSQADAFAQQWLHKIARGELDQAFYETWPEPRKNMQPNELRRTLETKIITTGGPDSTIATTLSGFGQADYVRLLQRAGEKVEIQRQGGSWGGYEGGGYQVGLTYRIKTPLASWLQLVSLVGSETKARNEPGRQWSVKIRETGAFDPSAEPGRSTDPIVFTEEGKEVAALGVSARQETNSWLELLREGKTNQACLSWLPASERQPQKETEKAGLLMLAAGPLTRPQGVSWQDLGRWQSYLRGDRIKADAKTFWAVTPEKRFEALQEVREMLSHGLRRQDTFKLASSRVPLETKEGKRTIVPYDFQVVFNRPSSKGELPTLVEARLVLSAEDPHPMQGPVRWQVDAIELIRTRNVARQGPQ